MKFDDFLSEIDDRKESEEEKNVNSKQSLVPNKQMCEDGATVAATPTFSAAGCLIRPDRQRSSMEGPKTVGNSH